MRSDRDILPWQIGLVLAVLLFLCGSLLAECPPQAPPCCPDQAPPLVESVPVPVWRQNDRGNWCKWHEGRWWTKQEGRWWTAPHGGTFRPYGGCPCGVECLCAPNCVCNDLPRQPAPVLAMLPSFGGGFRGGASARGGC